MEERPRNDDHVAAVIIEEPIPDNAAVAAEDEGEEEDGDESTINTKDEDPKMLLSEEEWQWAVAIKEAIAESPDYVDPVSDYFCAQLALIDQDCVEDAVERAHRLQVFREEYDIVDNLQTAKRFVRLFMELFPGFLLSFTWNEGLQCYIIAMDWTKFEVRILSQRRNNTNTWLTALYFMGHMISPNFTSIRQGVSMLVECEGYSWKENFGLSIFRRYWTEIASVYPVVWRQIKYFHSGVTFNLLVSMVRRYLPASVHSRFQVGCVCEMGRLDRLYLSPDVDSSLERFFREADACLESYYENVAAFSLSS